MDASTKTAWKPWTAAELSRLPEGWRYEIDDGELVIMAPAGHRHWRIVNAITRVVGGFVHDRHLGEAGSGEPGVYLQREPAEVLRAADVLCYTQEKLELMRGVVGFPAVPPDLVVEVHLPYELDMPRKVRQYLTAGVRSVWVVDPAKGTLTQYRSGEEPRMIGEPDATVTEPVLPGFSCRLLELLGQE